MPKIKQSPKLPAERRKRQLLASASKLFMKKGYRGTTTEEIAREAGLTKGSIYYHFKSKEDILFALVQQIGVQHRKAVGLSMSDPVDPLQVFGSLSRIYDSGKIAGFRSMVEIYSQAIRIPRIKRFIAGSYNKRLDDFVSRMDKRYGRTRKDRKDLAVFTFALLEGLVLRKGINPQIVDNGAQLRLFKRFLETGTRIEKKRKQGGNG